MTLNEWIYIGVAIIGGIVVGIVASRIVRMVIGAPSRPEPIRGAAGPLASLALWAFVVVGLVAALGVASPDALDQLPKDVVQFIPRVISAAIVVIVANVASSFAQAAVAPAIGRMATSVQRQILSGIRLTIMSLAILLAVRQLGFDTTVVNLGVAAIFFGLAGSLMLLVSLGGRQVAEEVASTRILRRLVNTGDRIELDDISGTVVGLHPTAVEVVIDGRADTVIVPSSRFLSGTFRITRIETQTPSA